jgi:predicted nucleic acid-binding protein
VAEVFVDASAWFPLIVASRAEHRAVRSALEDALRAGARLVTSNLVVAETHALLMQRTSADLALAFVRATTDPSTVVIYSTEELEHLAATEWLTRYRDQNFSLTDAVSFTIMKRRGITRAITLDRHFAIAGFDCSPAPAVPSTRKSRSMPKLAQVSSKPRKSH